jgi:hypothetical protein
MATQYFVGLDLGQRRDHTAIAIVERVDRNRGYEGATFDRMVVRYLERVPLGTTYPQVVERVRTIVESAELRGRCALAVDSTGVGAPVVEMLRAARLGCEVTAVMITSGNKANQAGQVWNVPKRDLISGVQVLLERAELKIAKKMRNVGALVRELMDVRSVTRENGLVRLGADGSGEHDDLVIAVALACWRARRPQNGFGNTRLI